jgi:hypothetical protein
MPRANDDIDGSRRCRDCGEWKPIEEFHTNSRRPGGRGSYCQPCFNERSKASYARRVKAKQNRDVRQARVVPEGMRYCPDCDADKPIEEYPRNRADSSGYASYCKPCHNKRGRESKIKNHGGTRHYHLKRRYGIGADVVESMVRAQWGVCAICERPNPQHVDHDHTSGEVRGILCFNCNAGLGQPGRTSHRRRWGGNELLPVHFKDDIATMRKAITYLKETSWQRVLVQPGVYRLRSPRRACLPSRNS